MRDVAVDACCVINLCAAGKVLDRGASSDPPQRRADRTGGGASPNPATGLGLKLHIPNKVAEETLYILQPDPDDVSRLVKTPVDLDKYTAVGLLNKCDLESQEEIELFVQMAARIGDGEAACFAIAATRGWALATDDRRARRFAADSNVTVITTPELIKSWAENTQASGEEVASVLQNIQRFAYFVPRDNSPECAWWMNCLGK